MPFQTGNKLGGRTKGSTNKSTEKIKKAYSLLLENSLEKIQVQLDKLPPKDYLNYLLSLSQYVIPKMKYSEVETTTHSTIPEKLEILIDNISDEEFEQKFKD